MGVKALQGFKLGKAQCLVSTLSLQLLLRMKNGVKLLETRGGRPFSIFGKNLSKQAQSRSLPRMKKMLAGLYLISRPHGPEAR